ncbi:MAG TPA: glycosyltransferase family 4 protein [Gemmatimonadales bacterium]|nr:glycosyltransferase family 4 protein [Gemmatimonadales bacterium]
MTDAAGRSPEPIAPTGERVPERRSGPRAAKVRLSGPTNAGAARAQRTPRRVLVVAPQPFYEDRGTPIAVYNVLKALSELGHPVDLVTYPIGRRIELTGVRVFRAANPFRIHRVPIGFSFRKVLLDATLVITMWRRLRGERYAFVHAVEEAAFPAAVLGRRRDVPVIYDMQSSLPEQMVTRRLLRLGPVQRTLRACERWLLRRVDVVVSSAGLLKRVNAEAPDTVAHEWRFPIIPAAPSPERVHALRRELALADDTPVVLYAGTFEPYQGLPTLLDAFPRVRSAVPGAVMVLVGGEGEAAAAIERDVAERGLTGAVRLVGRKPREEIPGYLAMADVLVSPRRYGANLPLKVFDYLAAGRPIVATDVPAHRAVLDESLARLTAPSADALAEAIVELLQHPSRAAAIAESGRAYAARHFGWQRFVQAVSSIYDGAATRADVRASV